MAINPDLAKLRREIDRLLREQRPDRYVTRADAELEDEVESTEWLDRVAEQVEHLVPEIEVIRLYARNLVGQREGQATQTANQLLRKIHRSGQLVLGWFDVKDDPVSVLTRIIQSGQRVKIVEERVALRAMSPTDFRKFADEERRRAARDASARYETCEGADYVADQMSIAGAIDFLTWATQELPPDIGSD